MAGDISRDHLLLKVMGLARPRFYENVCVPVDACDSVNEMIVRAVCQTAGQDSMDIPISQFLMAPQKFDNIYLGETFMFYVCVQNISDQKLFGVCVSTDLQTTNQRIGLSSILQDANETLDPNQCLGTTINHEIKETGQHILVCAVNYKTSSEQKLYFRKFFKFPVTKPIDVRTKFFNAEDTLNIDVYLEAQIQNISSASMQLEKVSLQPSDFYSCVEIPPPRPQCELDSEPSHVNPGDIRQFLYCLKPKISDYSDNYYRRGISIGKLDIVWRGKMGEKGHLQTSGLQRLAPGYGDLHLTIEKIPDVIQLYENFEITCRLRNCSERSMNLILHLDGSLQPSIIFCSTSGVSIGQLLPHSVKDFTLDLFPIFAGLQNISGIRVTDTSIKRTYEYDDFAQVFIK